MTPSRSIRWVCLIEEQRTNLLTYSNLVGGWASLTTGNTIATGEADPAGGTSGTLYTRTAALSYRGQGASKAASAITYTQSFYVKKNTANYAVFTMQGFNSGQRISQSVDLATGVLSAATTAGAFAHVGSSVDTLIDNWYRVKIVFTTDTHTIVSSFITFATSQILTADSNDSASTATGYVYGAQLEAGAFPSSYIPTQASQVTRAADQVSILTSAFAHNAAEGSLVTESDTNQMSGASYSYVASFGDGTANERMVSRSLNTTFNFAVVDGGVTQASNNLGTVALSTMYKAAFAYKQNDFAVTLNGGVVGTDVSGTVPTVTTLKLGADSAAMGTLNGHIKRLTYFPTRKSNAELQVLST
jgi:hypothetical protein